jgi:endonuclease YncB( thermonuclease family)
MLSRLRDVALGVGIGLVLAGIAFGFYYYGTTFYPTEPHGLVDHVVDGDTIRLRGYDFNIRLWGINAPERGQPGYNEATAALNGFVAGQSIRCMMISADSKWGRFVGQCFLPDKRDVSRLMIESRLATEECQYSKGYYGTCPQAPEPH